MKRRRFLRWYRLIAKARYTGADQERPFEFRECWGLFLGGLRIWTKWTPAAKWRRRDTGMMLIAACTNITYGPAPKLKLDLDEESQQLLSDAWELMRKYDFRKILTEGSSLRDLDTAEDKAFMETIDEIVGNSTPTDEHASSKDTSADSA